MPPGALTGLEAADQRVPCFRGVLVRVLRRSGVAATDVSAQRTATQVKLPADFGQAGDASRRDRWSCRIDRGFVRRAFPPPVFWPWTTSRLRARPGAQHRGTRRRKGMSNGSFTAAELREWT